MIVVKKGDYIYAKVDFEKRESFKKHVKGAIWDGSSKSWKIPATISTFKNLRVFDPVSMEPTRLTPGIRAWYNELLARAKRIDELQRGIPDDAVGKSVCTTTTVGVGGDGDTSGATETSGGQSGESEQERGCIPAGNTGSNDGVSTNEICRGTGSTIEIHRSGEHGDNNEHDTRGPECHCETTTDGTSGGVENGGTETNTPETKTNDRVLPAVPTDVRDTPSPVVFPDGFRFPYAKPFKHQREAIAFCINLKKAALWLDLGLGKTFTSINVARFRHQFNGVNRVLVVAPRSLLYQWVGELKSFAPEAKAFVVEGTPAKKRKVLGALASTPGLVFAIVTYESMGSLKLQLNDTQFGFFILDESTKIKNPKAARSRATVDVCSRIEYGLALTGLAYLNNPLDLFSQFLALDTTVYGTDSWVFSERYIDWIKAPFGRMMRGLRNMDELKRRAYFIAFSRTKSQCLDLPEKTYLTRRLPMFDTQKVWYDKVSDEILSTAPDIINVLNVSNVLTKLEKLQQITAGFVILDDGQVVWFDSPKYRETCEIIVESTESFIIWCRHTEAIKRMGDALLAYNIQSEQLNRYTSSHRRTQGIKQFREGKLKVLICQITSESKGLNLTCATNSVNSIYLENTFSINWCPGVATHLE